MYASLKAYFAAKITCQSHVSYKDKVPFGFRQMTAAIN